MLPASAFRPPLTLDGPVVRLVPLAEGHAGPLSRAAQDPEVFRYLRTGGAFERDRTIRGMQEVIAELLSRVAAGTDLPFAAVRVSDSRPIGMTRYLDIDRANATVEVGGTWFERSLWGTGINAASKRLMLAHAFEVEGVNRVQIKTDERNLRSQRAIEKLGAVREGILREHIILPDGHLRSSVYFSILRGEWPKVRAQLDARLDGSSTTGVRPLPG